MVKVKNRLNELTKDLYLKYRRSQYSDDQIRGLYKVSPNVFVKWKKENGIPLGLNIKSLAAVEILFPDEIEKMKKKYMKFRAMGWADYHVKKELGISGKKLAEFKKRYFPDDLIKERFIVPDEQMAIATANGITRKMISVRIADGWTLEQALTIPKGLTRNGKDKFVEMWETRKAKEREQMPINELCNTAHSNAREKGFYDLPVSIPQSLALIHSEVSEALEADRKGDADNFAEELADICIRVFDLAGWRQIDLAAAIEYKMAKNKERPRKHGKRY